MLFAKNAPSLTLYFIGGLWRTTEKEDSTSMDLGLDGAPLLTNPHNKHVLIICGTRPDVPPVRIAAWNAKARDQITVNLLRIGLPLFVFTGGAKGWDTAGEQWATLHMPGYHEVVKADWSAGRGGGIRRNEAMFKKAVDISNLRSGVKVAVLAFWDGKSHGTKHMIDFATANGANVTVIRVDE